MPKQNFQQSSESKRFGLLLVSYKLFQKNYITEGLEKLRDWYDLLLS